MVESKEEATEGTNSQFVEDDQVSQMMSETTDQDDTELSASVSQAGSTSNQRRRRTRHNRKSSKLENDEIPEESASAEGDSIDSETNAQNQHHNRYIGIDHTPNTRNRTRIKKIAKLFVKAAQMDVRQRGESNQEGAIENEEEGNNYRDQYEDDEGQTEEADFTQSNTTSVTEQSGVKKELDYESSEQATRTKRSTTTATEAKRTSNKSKIQQDAKFKTDQQLIKKKSSVSQQAKGGISVKVKTKKSVTPSPIKRQRRSRVRKKKLDAGLADSALYLLKNNELDLNKRETKRLEKIATEGLNDKSSVQFLEKILNRGSTGKKRMRTRGVKLDISKDLLKPPRVGKVAKKKTAGKGASSKEGGRTPRDSQKSSTAKDDGSVHDEGAKTTREEIVEGGEIAVKQTETGETVVQRTEIGDESEIVDNQKEVVAGSEMITESNMQVETTTTSQVVVTTSTVTKEVFVSSQTEEVAHQAQGKIVEELVKDLNQ